MKPAAFDVEVASDIDHALTLLADDTRDAKLLAGGQSLVALMNFRLARPEMIIDLNRVDELQGIRVDNGALHVGAMTRQGVVERSSAVAAGWPLLAEALPFVAHAPIRNRGTLGGSLAHADSSAELCAVSLALDARLVIRSLRGRRVVDVEDFFLGPFTTALEEDELLVEIEVPETAPRYGSSFLEVARRSGDFATVAVAAAVSLGEAGEVANVRLAYASMASTPVRAIGAEDLLRGAMPGPDQFEAAATMAAEELAPSTDLHASADYRKHLARVLTRRALAIAHQRAIAASR